MSKQYYPILIFLYLTQIIKTQDLDDEKYYFQIYPSESEEESYAFHLYSQSVDSLINSTNEDPMEIIRTTQSKETPIKHLSSMMTYKNKFLIKTCFGPKKIIEIKDSNKETFSPENDYFKNVQNNLENIKYCFTTRIYNPEKLTEDIIITYWTEAINENGVETYAHKSILFYPDTKKFSDIFQIKTNKSENFYPQSCTNQRNLFIYCTIDPSFPIVNTKDIFIDPSYIGINKITLKLVTIVSRLSNSIYRKPIGLVKSIYSYNGKKAEYFLMEYHDKNRNITRLATSLYINSYNMTFILRFEEFKVDYGINIEDIYIHPNLFNYIVPNNDEIIVIYIMKNFQGKNILLLNRYDYEKSIKVRTNFDKYTSSNYLREDICENPQYIQSMYIKSYISYENKDKEIIETNPDAYFKYQKDIATVISCKKENNEIYYQYIKIIMPQCLSDLGKINGIDSIFKYDRDHVKIILDIYNDPNLKSLREAEIIFGPSDLYNRVIIIQPKKNGELENPINNTISINPPEYLEFSRTINFQKNKLYRIPYRIRQTKISNIISSCHLTSDWCYFEFIYPTETGEEPETTCKIDKINYCEIMYGIDCTCQKCYEDQVITTDNYYIIGNLLLSENKKECICDISKGFRREPVSFNSTLEQNEIRMCICKEGYSFYKDRYMCLPDIILTNGNYCIEDQDDNSGINIYDDLKGRKIEYKDGLPHCPEISNYKPNVWFPMGEYSFNFVKFEFNDCVFILYQKTNELIMYSDRAHCQFQDDFDYKQYLNVDLKTKEEFDAYLNNSIEFQPDNENFTLIKDDLENNITFFIQNDYIKKKFTNLSTIEVSEECLEKISPTHRKITIFNANIKREDIGSTQVEYQLYNTKQIEASLDLSSCSKKDEEEMLGRRLKNEDENNNGTNPAIKITVKINWNDQEKNNIEELYDNKNIYLFNASDPFYNDVCYKYRTPDGHDIYLQNRRDEYYPNRALCENNCTLSSYDNITKRVICDCNIKITPENYKIIEFHPEPRTEEFNKTFSWPNIKVIKCILEADLSNNPFNYFLFILFVVFFLFYCYYRQFKKSEKYPKKLDYDENFEDLFKTIEDEKDSEEKKFGNNESDSDDDSKFHRPPKDQQTEKNSQEINNINNNSCKLNKEVIDTSSGNKKGYNNNFIINNNDSKDEYENKEDKKSEIGLIDEQNDKKSEKDLIDEQKDKKSEKDLIDEQNDKKSEKNLIDNKGDNNSQDNKDEKENINEHIQSQYENEQEKKGEENKNPVVKSLIFDSYLEEYVPSKIDSNKYDGDSDKVSNPLPNPPNKGKNIKDKTRNNSSNNGNKKPENSRDYESNSEEKGGGKVYYEGKYQTSSAQRIQKKKKEELIIKKIKKMMKITKILINQTMKKI